MTEHAVGTQEEWQVERDRLLAEEKEITRRNDELTKKRRDLGCRSRRSTASRRTMGPSRWPSSSAEARSCSSTTSCGRVYGRAARCGSITDNLDPNAVHLKARDTTLMLVSRAPLEKLRPTSSGWAGTSTGPRRPAATSTATSASHTEEELKPFLEGEIPQRSSRWRRPAARTRRDMWPSPGLSAYALSDGVIYRTYVTTARGLEPTMGYYFLLDRTPLGRNEEESELAPSPRRCRALAPERPHDPPAGSSSFRSRCAA